MEISLTLFLNNIQTMRLPDFEALEELNLRLAIAASPEKRDKLLEEYEKKRQERIEHDVAVVKWADLYPPDENGFVRVPCENGIQIYMKPSLTFLSRHGNNWYIPHFQ
jgi:hypothetical protein